MVGDEDVVLRVDAHAVRALELPLPPVLTRPDLQQEVPRRVEHLKTSKLLINGHCDGFRVGHSKNTLELGAQAQRTSKTNTNLFSLHKGHKTRNKIKRVLNSTRLDPDLDAVVHVVGHDDVVALVHRAVEGQVQLVDAVALVPELRQQLPLRAAGNKGHVQQP